jgi:hypothetical protein
MNNPPGEAYFIYEDFGEFVADATIAACYYSCRHGQNSRQLEEENQVYFNTYTSRMLSNYTY